MKRFRFLLLGLLLSSTLAAETLVYEREYSLLAGPDNILRIEIGSDGLVTIHRPVGMTKPGTHRRWVDSSVYEQLRREFDEARVDSDRLSDDIERVAANELRVVTDPEYSRFFLLDDSRAVGRSFSVVSLEAWAQLLDDDRLERLDQFENRWFAVMNAALEVER